MKKRAETLGDRIVEIKLAYGTIEANALLEKGYRLWGTGCWAGVVDSLVFTMVKVRAPAEDDE